jgi:hypothetical protein
MIIYVFEKPEIFIKLCPFLAFCLKYMGKMVRAGAGSKISDKLEPEPHKNGPALQHFHYRYIVLEQVRARK